MSIACMPNSTLSPNRSPIEGEGSFVRAFGAKLGLEAA
jgi:hypothetical protein